MSGTMRRIRNGRSRRCGVVEVMADNGGCSISQTNLFAGQLRRNFGKALGINRSSSTRTPSPAVRAQSSHFEDLDFSSSGPYATRRERGILGSSRLRGERFLSSSHHISAICSGAISGTFAPAVSDGIKARTICLLVSFVIS